MSVRPRKRGRPANQLDGRLAAADAAIIRAIYLLDGWGFSLIPLPGSDAPSGVFECVAAAALACLGRGDGSGRPLSAKRLEQLYRRWKREEFHRYFVLGQIPEPFRFPPKVWSRYKKSSLRRSLPFPLRKFGLPDLASKLLSGAWSEQHQAEEYQFYVSSGYIAPQMEPTPAWEKVLEQMPRVRGRRKTA